MAVQSKPRVRHPDSPGLRIRVVFGGGLIMGPGRADLLDGIRETGSIAAAGRRMGMSYKRAWRLAEALNETFAGPLIEASKGGVAGGGAHLTPLGAQVLGAYRDLEAAAAAAGTVPISTLRDALGDALG